MKEAYNRLFEKAAPRTSDEELFRLVLSSGKECNMENNNTSPKKRKMAPMIAVAAAATAVVTTAGAVATYSRNISEDYNDVFAQTADVFPQAYKDKDGNTLDQKEKALENGMYEKLNVEINKTFEFEEFTFEVPGAVSDGEDLYIMYNLIFNEDPWTGANPWFTENENVFLMGETDCVGVSRSGKFCDGTVSKRDGKTVYSSHYPLTGLENCADTLKVSFNCIWGSSMMSGEHYFDAEIEIPISDSLTKFNKTVDVFGEPYVKLGNWGDWDIARIEVTPLGVTFNMKTDGETPHPSVCKFYSPEIPVCVTFEDDTTLDLTRRYSSQGIDKENKTLRVKMLFNYPVDVDEIRSIQFASAAVDMNGGVTTVDIAEIPIEADWRHQPSEQH